MRLDPRIKIKSKIKKKISNSLSKSQKGKYRNDDYTILNHAKFSQKTNVSYPLIPTLVRIRGLEISKNLESFVSLKPLI